MEHIFEYSNADERKSIIEDNRDKYLITEKNIKEGNFLIFSDTRDIEMQVEQLQVDNTILLMAITDLYEDIQTLKGGA